MTADNTKQNKWKLIKGISMTIIGILCVVSILNVQSFISPNNACAYSPYQHLYNNATNSVIRWFGECHTTSTFFYKEEVDCRGGFLGIGQSCVIREHYELGNYNVCYKLKNGKVC